MSQCTECKNQFERETHENQLAQKLRLPARSLCLTCLRRERLAFWTFGNFHVRTCDLSGETIVSVYPKDARFPVYKRSHWFSDAWEPPRMQYDKTRSFFEQLVELQSKTPHPHMVGDAKTMNCDYSDDAWSCKNCYLSRSMVDCENLHYSYRNLGVKDSIDVTFCFGLEQCYWCTYCFNSYNLHYAVNSRYCIDSYFLFDCRNCSDCFMSWNLRNKKYCFLNKQYSKEEYEAKVNSIDLSSYATIQKLQKEFEAHVMNDVTHPVDWNAETEDCVGNYLEKCHACTMGFGLSESENCFDATRGLAMKDCMYASGVGNGELCTNTILGLNCYNVHNAFYSADCSDCEYLDQCYQCENCFGCVGLRKKQYCILNTEYSKEEYERLKGEIIERMKQSGEYGRLPRAMTYTGYNVSLATFYWQLSREDAQRAGYMWEDEAHGHPDGKSTALLPDKLIDAPVDSVKQVLLCCETNRPFKMIPQEMEFYKKHNTPLPRLYPDHRNRLRFKYLLAVDPREIVCTMCGKTVMTYYPESWGYKKIACRECYVQTVG